MHPCATYLRSGGLCSRGGLRIGLFLRKLHWTRGTYKMESVMILSCIARVDKNEAMLNLGQNETRRT